MISMDFMANMMAPDPDDCSGLNGDHAWQAPFGKMIAWTDIWQPRI